MLYLVNWTDRDTDRMLRGGAEIIEARSVYDAKSKFLRAHWSDLTTERRPTMAEAVFLVRAKCLEDERFAFPLSDRSLKDPNRAYEELRLAGVNL